MICEVQKGQLSRCCDSEISCLKPFWAPPLKSQRGHRAGGKGGFTLDKAKLKYSSDEELCLAHSGPLKHVHCSEQVFVGPILEGFVDKP